MLEDTFSTTRVDRHHLKLREEPLSKEKILHFYLHLEPKRKAPESSGRGRRAATVEPDIRENAELFVVLLYHLIKDYFTKERLADETKEGEGSAEEPSLASAIAKRIERIREGNENLVMLSDLFRTHLNLLELFHLSLCGPLG